MNTKKIKTTFTYKGRKIVIRSKVEDVIRNDEFAYILTGEKGDNHNPEDPYFEINLYTKWNAPKNAFDILPKGYVNHFPNTEAVNPDWSTESVEIVFS